MGRLGPKPSSGIDRSKLTVACATDEFGLSAVENRFHVHDLHATILHLMGLDHEKLTKRYSGRDFLLMLTVVREPVLAAAQPGSSLWTTAATCVC